jgi:hypothetical protein
VFSDRPRRARGHAAAPAAARQRFPAVPAPAAPAEPASAKSARSEAAPAAAAIDRSGLAESRIARSAIARSTIAACALAAFALVGAWGCGADRPGSDGPLGLRVSWLGEPSGAIPPDVEILRIAILFADGTSDETEFTVANLPDLEGDGRPERALEDLPVGEPFRIRVLGLDAARAVRHVGRTAPIVLSTGERRYVDLAMYQVDVSAPTVGTLPGRFLATATALPDGRVLVAGGFDAIRRVDPCPSGIPATSRCFEAMATSDAYVFAPATGRFARVEGGMLEARGGHAATALPDGRVLVTGGASRALVVFEAVGDPATGYVPTVLPRGAASDADTALASFEIFLPDANAEEADVGRDGDDGRGGFTGAASAPDRAGDLQAPRFLHAAAAVPGSTRVVLAGGVTSPRSFEVFDDRRAGGYGVLPGLGALGADRVMPSAIGVGSGSGARVWIVGGVRAPTNNEQLADVWSPPTAGEGIGTATPASMATAFPRRDVGTPVDAPEHALWRPELATVGGGAYLLAVGWLGPRCADGSTTPTFGGAIVCAPGEPPRGFTVTLSTGQTQPTPAFAPRALGASAVLDDGSFVVGGGWGSLVGAGTSGLERFTGDVTAGRAVRPAGSLAVRERLFPAMAAIPDRGVLTVGGLVVATGASGAALSSPVAEVAQFRVE